MKRKIIVLLPIVLFIPIFLWAAGGQDIAATTKLKGVIKDGVQIVAGLIALIAVIKIGLSTATKSILSGQEISQKETKDIITKLGYLIIGLSNKAKIRMQINHTFRFYFANGQIVI